MRLNRSIPIACAVFAGAASAQSSVTIYGIIDVGIQHLRSGNSIAGVNGSADSKTRMESAQYTLAGNRLGFRAVEDLGGGLNAGAILEHGFDPRNGNPASSTSFFNRQIFTWLGSKSFGELRLGRQYRLQDEVIVINSPFNNGLILETNYGYRTGGSPGAPTGFLPMFIDNARVDNAVQYISPTISGFKGQLMYAFKEVTGEPYRAAKISYAQSPVTVAISYEMQGDGPNPKSKILTLGGSYDFGVAKLMGGYQRGKNVTAGSVGAALNQPAFSDNIGSYSDTESATIGIRKDFGPFALGSNYSRVNFKNSAGEGRSLGRIAIGASYSFSKQTRIFAAYGQATGELKSKVIESRILQVGLNKSF